MVLETDRLIIHEISQADIQQFLALDSDGDEMTSYLNALPEDVVQDALQNTNAVLDFVRMLASLRDESDMKRYGAWNRAGDLIACVGLTSWSTGTPELQITVAESQRRCGYATEFLQCLLPWIFQNSDTEYIVYRLRKGNDPSEKIVQRLGGVLQEPKSKLEALTIATYHVYRNWIQKNDSAEDALTSPALFYFVFIARIICSAACFCSGVSDTQ